MKNLVGQYLLAAMASDAAFVARDQGQEYDLLATFGRTAASADRLANLCNGEGECSAHTIRKIRDFLKRNSFGAGEWYREALSRALSGKKIELNEVNRSRKEAFDQEFRRTYEVDPPDLTKAAPQARL